MTTKQIDIKNRTYYFHSYLINIKNFDPNMLKLDKSSAKSKCSLYWICYQKKQNMVLLV